eukprot:GHVS01007096.1.p1 GENE.GHVS01007096.1~~GHVS01007096.1.p1  ORF type:complete len:366 (+),score=64.01 GHVS01007096.1:96-1193(+)
MSSSCCDVGGVGSVWNTNSWHWEEKNYGVWAEKYLLKLLASLDINATVGGVVTAIRLTTPNIKGESSVSVRKRKRVAVCEYNIKCHWEARQGDNIVAAGTVNIPDFTGQDDDYVIDVSSDASDDAHTCYSAVMRLEGVNAVRRALCSYMSDLMEVDREAMSVEEDKKRREEEIGRAADAEKLKGNEKQHIAQQIKEKDDKLKSDANSRPKSIPEGQGSVWNANSYHWEEKPQTQWSLQALRARLETAELQLLGVHGIWKFFNVNVTGEASTSIRKGNKIIIFDFRISTDWIATTRDEQGKFLADSRGQLDIPEFSSDDTDDYQINLSCDTTHLPAERINDALRKEGIKALRDCLHEFVVSLESRG